MSRDDLASPYRDGTAGLVARLDEEVRLRLAQLPRDDRVGFVSSELLAVHATLQAVLEQDLARGPIFCEWGSGLGAVCAVAASLSLRAHGIEIQPALVEAARDLVAELELDAAFAYGSFVMAGDEDLCADCDQTVGAVNADAYEELGLGPEDCDIVFAYPWPGEDRMYDQLFARHATPGALLITFHEQSRVLVQRRTEDDEELAPLGWFGTPGA